MLKRLLLGFVMLAALASFLDVLYLSNQVSAITYSRPTSRRPLNDAEEEAKSKCNYGARGAIWFSTASATDYYAQGVTINGDDNSVRVYIRGSMYSCANGDPGRYYAYDIEDRTRGTNRLTNFSSRTLYRGYITTTNNQWSSTGGHVTADLNVSNVARNYNSSGIARQTISIPLYRCPRVIYNGKVNESGECYTTDTEVQVTRRREWDTIGYTTMAVRNASSAILNTTTRSNEDSSDYTYTTGAVGQRVVWDHRINVRPIVSGRSSITYQMYRTGFSSVDEPGGSKSVTFNDDGDLSITDTWSSSYVITAADRGKTLCEYIRWSPAGMNSSSELATRKVCIRIPLGYQLEPEIDHSGTVVSPGETLALDKYKATMTAPSGSPPTVSDWQLTRFVFKPGVQPSSYSGWTDARDARSSYSRGGAPDIAAVKQGAGFSFPVGESSNMAGQYTEVVDDIAAGSRICFVMSVKPYETGNSNWAHSAMKCVMVAKLPLTQVWGGDVMVGDGGATGSDVITSIRLSSDGRSFGSWAEYAIMAPGKVESVSAAALSRKEGRGASAELDRLTFANSRSPRGGFTTGYASNIASDFRMLYTAPINLLSANINVGNPALTAGRYTKTTGNLSVSGNPTKTIVIDAPNSVVTITGNIDYGGATYGNTSRLPQVVIIAQDIVIDSAVTRVDAWLIARDGTISTCGPVRDSPDKYYTGLTTGTCDQQLMINGPVISERLQLRRTFGAEAPAGSIGDARDNKLNEPAEIINLRADAYIWANSANRSYGEIRTTYTRDISPRF